MCRPVTCKTCAKTTWAGCGEHVADVKRTVPADQWCDGHDDQPKDVAPTGSLKPGKGLLGWLSKG